MKRFLTVMVILITAVLLGFVLWYGPWSAGWFSGKAWEFQESKEDIVQKNIPKNAPND